MIMEIALVIWLLCGYVSGHWYYIIIQEDLSERDKYTFAIDIICSLIVGLFGPLGFIALIMNKKPK